MKGSLTIIAFFILGGVLAYAGWLPDFVYAKQLPAAVLFLLMFEVGLSIGSDRKLKTILSAVRPKLLLVPLATVAGTLLGAALVGLFLTRWSVAESLAVGSGFGYYSLSSILIVELKTASLGAEAARQLGTVALLSNMLREMFTLVLAPLLVRYFGKFGPICAGGVTSMDATLPIITRFSGKEWVFLAVLHGVLLDFSVPFFVSFFCLF